MIRAGVAGKLPARSRVDSPARLRARVPLYRPAPDARGSLAGPLLLSAIGHALFVAALVGVMMWTVSEQQKLYVVNLVPAVAAVGTPTAPPTPSPAPRAPVPAPPVKTPVPEPLPPPRPPAVREPPARLPEPSWATPRLPARTATPRAGEKELPPLVAPRTANVAPPPRAEKADKIDKPVDSRPAPSATLGQATGSPVGTGALTIDVSDFPYAWYLRQVLQKVQSEWQRQNRTSEPEQKPLVLVEIQRDGSIRMPKIEQTSGNAVYDQAALRAVVDASPFPPLPQDWSKPSLRVMFRFDLVPARG